MKWQEQLRLQASKQTKKTKIPERYICIQTSSMTPETHKFGKHPGASRAGRGALFLLLVGGIGVLLFSLLANGVLLFSFSPNVSERQFSSAVFVRCLLAKEYPGY